MARKIFSVDTYDKSFLLRWATALLLTSFVFVALIVALLSLGGCKIETVEGNSSAQEAQQKKIEVYTETLALISGALDDFEGSTSTATLTNSNCLKSYACASTLKQTTTYNNCGTTEGAQLTGTVALAFSSNDACTAHYMNQDLPEASTVTKTLDSFVRRDSRGTVTVTTSSGGLRLTSFQDSGVNTNSVSIFPTERRIPGRFTLSISGSGESFRSQGRRSLGTRRISNGEIVLVESLSGLRGRAIFSNLSWTQSGCCYPTSGLMTVSLGGSRSGSETLDFSRGICGKADFTDADNARSEVTLANACE